MSDLNTAIALRQGWIKNPTKEQFCVPDGYPLSSLPKWYHPVTREILNSHDPDFEHDASLYMELFEEMPNPCIRKYNDEWLCIPEMRHSLVIKSIEEFSKDIGTAICQAYCKLKGIKL